MTLLLLATLVVGQPILELPPDADTPGLTVGADVLPDTELVRGLQEERLRARGTVIGSYGQYVLTYDRALDSPWRGVANLERLVLFVSHHFSDAVQGYVELEWEDAFRAVEVEQAFVDWEIRREMTLRSGLVLVPVGIINQWHEPPVFHGVKRPDVDTYVIPTTWRELGAGSTGRLGSTLRYEFYLLTAPEASQMGDLALRYASTRGSLTPANSFMAAGRLEAEPLLGVVVGVSALGGDLGDDVHYYNAAGDRVDLHLPLWGVSLDGRWRRSGVEARVLGTVFGFPNAAALMEAARADGSPMIDVAARGVVPTLWFGVYGELAYNVLQAVGGTTQQLLPFVRLEYYDTQAQLPRGYRPNHAREVLATTAGLSYRPLQQLVFKVDGQFRSRRDGTHETNLNAGMGYMF